MKRKYIKKKKKYIGWGGARPNTGCKNKKTDLLRQVISSYRESVIALYGSKKELSELLKVLEKEHRNKTFKNE